MLEVLKTFILGRLFRKLVSIAIGFLFTFLSKKFGVSFEEAETALAVDALVGLVGAFITDTAMKKMTEKAQVDAKVLVPGLPAAVRELGRGPQP